MDGITSPLSKTALATTLAREVESDHADSLFRDPYAALFTAAAPQAFTKDIRHRHELDGSGANFFAMMAVRTRFNDDFLLDSSSDGCSQVVLLAAGLDARAFRLPWPPGTRLFELDLLEIIAFKEEVLRESGAIPACERSVLAVDLLQDWTSHMTEAGFDSTETTAWLAEGLLRYLTADDVARLLGSPVRSPSQDALFPGPRWRGC